jgi:ribonuclease HII
MARRIDPSLIPSAPTLEYEQALWAQGLERVAGIDEAGRGALAGPVYAAAVVLPANPNIKRMLEGVRDSKQMSAAQRETWTVEIQESAAAWGVGRAGAGEIDAYGIMTATRWAAMRALEQCTPPVQHLLIDAIKLPEVPTPQTRFWKGDQRCLSIAAASVLAKVARDAELRGLDNDFPAYGFAQHKGYATRGHRQMIEQLGPCAIHRLSFSLLGEESIEPSDADA